MPDWREYQEQAAQFFRSLGFDVAVDTRVSAVRTTHKIDVWVTFNRFGLDHRWVIECKDWQRSIPQEKVLALRTIVEDIGADRGFLLSEEGFQPGAVRAAQNTNITLSSLADLHDKAEEDILSSAVTKLNRVVLELGQRIKHLYVIEQHVVEQPGRYEATAKPKPGVDGDGLSRTVGELAMVEWGLEAALLDQFPAFYGSEGERPLLASDLQSLIQAGQRILARISDWVERQEAAAAQTAES